MTRKTYRIHKHCGGKVKTAEGSPYCITCSKWLVGDAVERKPKKRPSTGT